MKKVVVILIVFVLMLGAMTGEIVFVNNFYNDLQSDLEDVRESIELNKDNVAAEDTVKKCKTLADKWENGKKYLLTLQNHNTVRNLDDKIISLNYVVMSDNYNDAVIFVNSAINYIDDVLLDSVPFLSNIF